MTRGDVPDAWIYLPRRQTTTRPTAAGLLSTDSKRRDDGRGLAVSARMGVNPVTRVPATRRGRPLPAGFRSGLADQPDRPGNAAIPCRPVPGQQPGGIDAFDPIERRDSLFWLERERRRRGTGDAGEDVASGHCVAEE